MSDEVVQNPTTENDRSFDELSHRLSRRDFIGTVFAISLLPELVSAEDKASANSLQTSNPALYNSLRRDALLYKLIQDPTENRRALEALIRVYDISTRPGQTFEQKTKSLNEIESIIDAERPMEPEVFWRGTGLFDTPKSHAELGLDPLEIEGVSFGIQSFGLIAGSLSLLTPPTAIAVGFGGMLGSPVLTALNRPDIISRFPAIGSPAHFQEITDWAVRSSLELHNREPGFRDVIGNEVVKDTIGFDFASKFRKLVSESRPPVRDYLRENQVDEKGEVADQTEAFKQLQEKMEDQVKRLEKLEVGIQKLIKEDLDRKERQKIVDDINHAAGELKGVAQVGGFIATHLLGSPKEGQAILEIGSALAEGYVAVGLYAANLMGPWAFAGAIASSAGKFLSALDSGPTFQEVVLKSLDLVHEKLDEVLKSLDRIEQRQKIIIEGLNLILVQMHENRIETRMQLKEIEREIKQAIHDTNLNFRETDLASFGVSLDKCKSLLKMEAGRRDHAWSDKLQEGLLEIYSFAERSSRKAAFSGDSASVRDFPALLGQAKERGAFDLMFAHLPLVGELLNPTLDLKNRNTGTNNLPNPRIWALAAQAYLEVRVKSMNVNLRDDEESISGLFKTGLEIRKAIMTSSSPESVRSVCNKVLELIGAADKTKEQWTEDKTLMGKIFKMLREYETPSFEVPILDYKLTKLEENTPGSRSRRGNYYGVGSRPITKSRIRDPNRVHHWVEEDPLDAAIRVGAIKLELVPLKNEKGEEVPRPTGVSVYKMIKNFGPEAGQVLFGEKLLTEIVFKGDEQYPAFRDRSLGSKREDPKEFLDECLRLARECTPYRLQNELPGIIEKQLAQEDLTAFEGAGVAVQMLTLATRVRYQPIYQATDSLALRDVTSIFSREVLNQYISSWAVKNPEQTYDIAVTITNNLCAELRKRANLIIELAEGAPEYASHPLVDEMLRRIAGYMIIQKIPLFESKEVEG